MVKDNQSMTSLLFDHYDFNKKSDIIICKYSQLDIVDVVVVGKIIAAKSTVKSRLSNIVSHSMRIAVT